MQNANMESKLECSIEKLNVDLTRLERQASWAILMASVFSSLALRRCLRISAWIWNRLEGFTLMTLRRERYASSLMIFSLFLF